MKKLITLTAIVVTALLFSCNDNEKDESVGPATTDTPPPAPAPADTTVHN